MIALSSLAVGYNVRQARAARQSSYLTAVQTQYDRATHATSMADGLKFVQLAETALRAAQSNGASGATVDRWNGDIAALSDKSLLKPLEAGEGEPRFMLLETLREFGRRQLAAAGEAETVQESHADYYYQFVLEAEQQIWGANMAEWVRRLDVENDNLRVVLNYYLAQTGGDGSQFWTWN